MKKNKKFLEEKEIPTQIDGAKDGVYKISFFDRIPYPIRALVFVYWIFGMIYFFIDWGLGELIPSGIDYFVYVHALVYGLVMDLIVYHIYELWDTSAHESKFYEIFHSKKFYSLFINLAIGYVWAALTDLTAAFIRAGINSVDPGQNFSWAFREPFTWALLAFGVHMLLWGIKTLGVYIYQKLTHKEAM